MTRSKAKDSDEVTSKLADEARKLGVEPGGYTSAGQLRNRLDFIMAERDAVAGGQTPAADDDSNDNLNTASDSAAANTKERP